MFKWIFKLLSSSKFYDYLDLEFKTLGLIRRWVLSEAGFLPYWTFASCSFS